ncbi:MAG: hypothetical protein ACREEW_10490 [Caulobacteraceae bacterium]
MSDPKFEDEAARKARRGRNIALFVGLMTFVIVVFIVTIVRLGGSVATHGF